MLCCLFVALSACLFEALSVKAAPGFFSVASSTSSYRRRFSPIPLLGVRSLN